MRESVKDLVLNVLSQESGRNGMTVTQIYTAIKAQKSDITYVKVETAVRAELTKEKPMFLRIKRGLYCLIWKNVSVKKVTVKKTLKRVAKKPKMKKVVVRRGQHKNKKVVIRDGKFRVEDHIPYMNNIAISLANEFYKDPEDILSEMILIALEVKDSYDSKKGTPTTFIRNQIAPRLSNKVRREIIPNVFKMVTVKGKNGTVKKKPTRHFIDMSSLNQPTEHDYRVSLQDSMDSAKAGGKIFNYGSRHDHDYEASDFRDKIMKHFLSSGVKDKDVTIISKKFGLDSDGSCMTLDEIGKEEGMTKEGVRQAIKRVFKSLRKKQNMLELKRMIA